MAFVTFRTIRIPRIFLLLLFCLGVVTWVGYEFSASKSVAPAVSVMQSQNQNAESDEQPPRVFAEIGREAPDFTLSRLDGSPTSLSAYKGRPVLLYFWASWCSYCVDGMPKLMAIKEQYQEQGLEILTVDIMERADKVRRAVQEHGLSLPVLLDDSGQVTQQYLIKATPTYIFIDKDGIYRDILVGAAREGALEGRLHPLLSS